MKFEQNPYQSKWNESRFYPITKLQFEIFTKMVLPVAYKRIVREECELSKSLFHSYKVVSRYRYTLIHSRTHSEHTASFIHRHTIHTNTGTQIQWAQNQNIVCCRKLFSPLLAQCLFHLDVVNSIQLSFSIQFMKVCEQERSELLEAHQYSTISQSFFFLIFFFRFEWQRFRNLIVSKVK